MENILLDSTKKLQIKLEANKTTTECDVTVSYVDTTGSTLTDGAQESRSNGTTLQDILSAPASGTMRNALTVTVVNNDTVQHVIYIYKVTGAGSYLVTEQTLATGASWDSNLNNNIFDWGAAINNAAAAIQVSNASKIGIWDALTGALRSVTMNNLVIYLDTFFMSLIPPGASGNVLTSNGSV